MRLNEDRSTQYLVPSKQYQTVRECIQPPGSLALAYLEEVKKL
jgi:hypothetical protein